MQNETAVPNKNPEVEQALEFLRTSEDFDVRNLVTTITANMQHGGDCFDLRGCAKVLALYKRT